MHISNVTTLAHIVPSLASDWQQPWQLLARPGTRCARVVTFEIRIMCLQVSWLSKPNYED